MKPAILAAAAVIALVGSTAVAQSVDPAGAPATAGAAPGKVRNGTAGVTGSVAPANPNGGPAMPVQGKSATPGSANLPYLVPATRPAPSGDDGSTSGKTNPD